MNVMPPADIKNINLETDLAITVIPACIVFIIIWKKLYQKTPIFWLLLISGIYLMLCGAVGCVAEYSVNPPLATSGDQSPLYWAEAFNLRRNLTDILGYCLCLNLLVPIFKYKEIRDGRTLFAYCGCLAILAIIMILDNLNDHFMSR